MGTRDVWHLLHQSPRALDIREKKHGVRTSGHKGGPFDKRKTMVYEQVGHKGGPFAHKPWCTSKWDISGDPLLKKSWCTNKWDIRGDPLLINHGVHVRASGT